MSINEETKKQLESLSSSLEDHKGWSVLFGAGASKAFGLPTMKDLTKIMVERIGKIKKQDKAHKLLLELCNILKDEEAGKDITIEKIMENLYYIQFVTQNRQGKLDLKIGSLDKIDGKDLTQSLAFIKDIILEECGKEEINLCNYENFLNFWLNEGVRVDELNIFTTNWDIGLELACDKLELRCIDGFVGSIRKYEDFESFNESIEKRLSKQKIVKIHKLHGSIDWIKEGEKVYKHSIEKVKTEIKDKEQMMIFPTPIKGKEILGFPYSELIRRFGKSAISEYEKPKLLVIGYSFPDNHINEIIKRACLNQQFLLYVIDPELENQSLEKLFGKYPGIKPIIKLKFEDFIKNIKEI